MAGSSRRKQHRSQTQQITAQAPQDSLSFNAKGEGRLRKMSIGLTVAYSKRHTSPSTSSALNDQGDSRSFESLLPENCEKFSTEPLKEPGSSPRKLALDARRQDSNPSKLKSLDPYNYTDASPKAEIEAAFNFSSCKMSAGGGREFASTEIVEVYRNRKSAAGSEKFVEEAFAARSESALIRYDRRKNTTVVGEIAIQKTQEMKSSKRQIGNHVRFNFDRETSPSPDNVSEKKDNKAADGCQSADSLRMKLRSALCLLNSSEKPHGLQENSGKEPKSDTIETDSDEPNQTAKASEHPSVFGGRRSNATSKQVDSVVETRISKEDSSLCTSPVKKILRNSNAKSKQGDSMAETRNSMKDTSRCTSPVENIMRSPNANSKQGDSAVKTRNSKKDSSPCIPPLENILQSSKAKSKQADSVLKTRKSKKASCPFASPVENIFSFDQDEWLNDAKTCSGDYNRRSRSSDDDRFLNPGNVLHTSPERKEDRCPTFTVVEEMVDHPTSSSPPSPVIGVPSTEFDGAGKTCNIDNESPSPSSPFHYKWESKEFFDLAYLSALDDTNGEEETADGTAVVLPVKEELQLFIQRESKRRSSRIAPRRNSTTEPQPRRQLRAKRKAKELSLSPSSRERSYSVPDVRLSEDEDDDPSDLSRALKEFALILQKFKRKLKMETDKRTSQILDSAWHNIQKQVEKIEGQIQSDLLKHTYFCKTKFREMDSNLQDQNEKLKILHEKFRNELSQQLQLYQSTLSQFEGGQIELKSIADRQKVSHRKLISQAQEFIQGELTDAEGKITAVRKVATNHLHLLKRVVGEIL